MTHDCDSNAKAAFFTSSFDFDQNSLLYFLSFFSPREFLCLHFGSFVNRFFGPFVKRLAGPSVYLSFVVILCVFEKI